MSHINRFQANARILKADGSVLFHGPAMIVVEWGSWSEIGDPNVTVTETLSRLPVGGDHDESPSGTGQEDGLAGASRTLFDASPGAEAGD